MQQKSISGSAVGDEPQKGIVWRGGVGGGIDDLIGQAFPGSAFVLPVMTLSDEALEHNITAMASWCEVAGVELAPHAKTSMSPELVKRQLAAGAWGLTVATVSQLMALRSVGVPRILLANQLVDDVGISWVAEELRADPNFEFLCYVDSVLGVDLLDGVLRSHELARPVRVLIELGHAGGRTGCRDVDDAARLADRLAGHPRLELAGVAGYEGSVGHDGAPDTIGAVRRYLDDLLALAGRVRDSSSTGVELIVSAGGSAFFDVVADAFRQARIPDTRCLLRSGAYVTHDDGFYATITPAARGVTGVPQFVPALRLWAHVLSRPEPGLVIAGAGRRDMPFDEGLPIVRSGRTREGLELPVDGFSFERLNDQHAFVRVPETSPVAPGDTLSCGISHPCTAFDKWRAIPVVRGGFVVEVAHTLF